MMTYAEFLARKQQSDIYAGFEPIWMPDFLYDFQRNLVDWALRKGKAAIFADCGLGKTPMQLVWAENVVRKTNRHVLIATPLAVGHQLLREAGKFGVEVYRSRDGTVPPNPTIVTTNYEQLHHFASHIFAGMVCDESSILKNFIGARRRLTTEFMRELPYRLLCTATAAPNDYMELGTSSEALGELGHMDMLHRFFVNQEGTSNARMVRYRWNRPELGRMWRFKGHAELPFWRWIASWARALRSPSDLGFDDRRFALPALRQCNHEVEAVKPRDGMLFDLPAIGLSEQREERRRTLRERSDMIAQLADHKEQCLVWCHLNAEGDLLSEIIPDALQIRGSMPDEVKEERLIAFADGELRVLVTKPKIGAWGLNLQNCAHVTFFPSHSYEQFYQGVRRCWRFGQKRPVLVDMVSTKGERPVLANLRRKAEQADRMFSALIAEMHNAVAIGRTKDGFDKKEEVPAWLFPTKK